MIITQTLRAIAPRANPAFVDDLATAMNEILPAIQDRHSLAGGTFPGASGA